MESSNRGDIAEFRKEFGPVRSFSERISISHSSLRKLLVRTGVCF